MTYCIMTDDPRVCSVGVLFFDSAMSDEQAKELHVRTEHQGRK